VQIVDESEQARDGFASEAGEVREVVYLGALTRYVVALDRGGELVAVRQNVETSSQDALDRRGSRVRLEWRPAHTFDLTLRRDTRGS
jgi:putative spermidine/putrescine transport system ATP-binding protein